MSGVESKLVDRKNPNGRNKEMGGNDLYKNLKFTGKSEDNEDCDLTLTKYETGSEIVMMINGMNIKFKSESKKLYNLSILNVHSS
jgi:hypothetical protein